MAETDGTEMTCQELVELVTEYLEGTLSPTDRERFEAHLPNCRGCRNYLEQLRQTIRTLGRLSEETVSSEARDTLLAHFRDWKRGTAPPV
ncbi:MAG: zf-HC2 domain-containing protein [Anaerolineae bacterium]